MFTPSSHVALENIHHTFGNLQLAFLPFVFASPSGRVITKGVTPLLAFHATKMQIRQNMLTSATLLTFLKKREIITKLLSVCKATIKFRGNRQGEIDPDDCGCYECDRLRAGLGIFSEAFTKHLCAFTNMCEQWFQFHFALAGQILSQLANCVVFGAKQLRCSANRTWILRFANSGKREVERYCDEPNPIPETEQVIRHLPLACTSSPYVSFLWLRWTNSS